MKITAPKGTSDMLPERARIWQFVQETAVELFETYGYSPLVTPTFEATDLFARSIGGATDIVRKEMYTFDDKGGRSMTLRPEGTASIVRAAIEHHLIGQGKVAKLYYWGPMFRYERPQSGRMREFYQIGIEALGSDDPALDAEVITLLVRYFSELGIADLEVLINSMGCPEDRPAYVETLRKYLEAHADELCRDCVDRTLANPLRVFDCKVEACQAAVEKAPKLFEHLCGGCSTQFARVREYLKASGIDARIDPRLVRGLDYYVRTTFEVRSPLLGAQNALGGGGRYDLLAEELGGPPTPGIGFALGVERTILALEAQEGALSLGHDKPVLVVTVDDSAKAAAVKLVQELRDAFVVADIDYGGRNLKGQMKQASRIGSPFAVIIGPDELASGEYTVRDMADGTERKVRAAEVVEAVASSLASEIEDFEKGLFDEKGDAE
jgi:histidyl-tRNA synthetase